MTTTIKFVIIILPILTYFLGVVLERRKHTRLNLLKLLEYFSKFNEGQMRTVLVTIDQKFAIGIPKGNQHFTVIIDEDDYSRPTQEVIEEIETSYNNTHEVVLELLSEGAI